MCRLRQMLTKKVGHISDNLYHSAIYEAQHDIRAHKQIAPTWNFDNWSRTRKLVYIVNVMNSYVRIICKYDFMEGIVNEKV